MNEAETCTHYILPALQKAGWSVINMSIIREEYPISKGRLIGNGKRENPKKADFVLQYKGQNLAVIEAKADSKYYTDGVGQAKDYAERLQVRFCYSTNGKKIYAIDRKTGNETDINTYPSPDELWAMTSIKENQLQDKLLTIPNEDKGGYWQVRYYQDNAIKQVLTAIIKGKTRILLTLATGTGKTAIAFQIVWKLFHAKWNLAQNNNSPRILFLADRNLLADQAFNAFSAFTDEALIRIRPSEVSKTGQVPTHGSVYFTIFQSFMTEDERGFRFGQYPADFFDFIIVDECHRGGANDESTWRGILDYFSSAVQLGLTATPKRTINTDTYNYFGEPVYSYSLKDGINDGYLTPFRVQQISSNLDGYTYDDKDTVLEGEVDIGDSFIETDFNRKIIIKERETHRVSQLLNLINKNEKTLIFCSTQKHALLIRDLVNQISSSPNTDYCHRVTSEDGSIGEQHLENFKDNEKTIPTILTTSYKLSTGVDMPELKNIVLLRTVNSMIEFKQIIGRGTRIFDGKDYFTIYDFVNAHKYFYDPEWDGEPIEPESIPKPCIVCNSYPCICKNINPLPCEVCGYSPCECIKGPVPPIEIKLVDGTKRIISSVNTSFCGIDGKPISVTNFLYKLFGDLPQFFTNEIELKEIWRNPETRKKLLDELQNLGYSTTQLKELQNLINAKNSDIFDVLSYIAFNKHPLSRTKRASNIDNFLTVYSDNQIAFIHFVLEQYINNGIDELDNIKLPDLLILMYGSIPDATKILGDVNQIKEVFVDFQQYLYA